jgi:transposase
MFNPLKIKLMQFKNFIGIDVSKLTLDISVVIEGKQAHIQQIGNDEKSIAKFFKTFQNSNDKESSIVCMEYTGVYNYKIINHLSKVGIHCWIEAGIQIKFSQGFTRGKTDKLDAQRIAMYAFTHQHNVKIYKSPRAKLKSLSALVSLRLRIVKTISNLTKPVGELKNYGDKETYKALKKINDPIIKQLQKQLETVDREIKRIISEDTEFNRIFKIITSVPGVGMITAVNIIISTNEFISINDAKKFACYSGVVPFEHSSGSSVRSRNRVSHKANKSIKSLLHMAALANLNSKNSDLKEYYKRKVEEGKNKMSVINAMRNKLVLRIFSCVNNNRLYQKNIC